jgi:peptide deformylase
MKSLPICCYPDCAVLRQKAKKVTEIDGNLQSLIDDMITTMQNAKGVGLAAPQIGKSLQVAVLQMPQQEPITLINPVIVKYKGEQLVTEGCLSIPGFYGQLKRPAEVMVKARDRQGKNIKIKARGLLAEAIEHEVDHLKGILYIDRLDSTDNLYAEDTGYMRSVLDEPNEYSH